MCPPSSSAPARLRHNGGAGRRPEPSGLPSRPPWHPPEAPPGLVAAGHPARLLRTEADDAVEPGLHADVRADVEPAGHVVRRDGADAGDGQAVDRSAGAGRGGLDGVEETADEAPPQVVLR